MYKYFTTYVQTFWRFKPALIQSHLIDLSAFRNLEYIYILGGIIDQKHTFSVGLNKLIKLSLTNCKLEKGISSNDSIDSANILSSLRNLEILKIKWLDFPINLEKLNNLKVLIIIIDMGSDLGLLQNLGSKLHGLSISKESSEIIYDSANTFFKSHNFSNITHLRLKLGVFNPEWLLPFNNNLKRLSLSGCGLKEKLDFLQSEGFFPQLEYMDLSSNSISIIKKGDFSQLKNLKYLDISNNRIKFCIDHVDQLKKDIFYGLSNLTTLDISLNIIESIDPEMFANTPMLANLKLGEFKYKLNDYIFKHLKHLKIE